MATSTFTTVELVRIDEPLDATERGAIAGFLAGYTGNTLISYTTDLRLFIEWCITNDVRLLEVRRAHLEIFGRTMEADGRMRSTVARRLSTLGSFYRYCHVEGILERNPAANVRRPKVDTESRTLGLDRNELGGLLVQAGLGSRAGSRVDLAAGDERAADQRSARRRHRVDGHGPRTPHPGDRAQGRQARHHPARPTDRADARSVHRGTHDRADLPRSQRATDGPLRR